MVKEKNVLFTPWFDFFLKFCLFVTFAKLFWIYPSDISLLNLKQVDLLEQWYTNECYNSKDDVLLSGLFSIYNILQSFSICLKESLYIYNNVHETESFCVRPHQDDLVVSVSASQCLGPGFTSCWVIPRTVIEIVQTAPLLGMQALG